MGSYIRWRASRGVSMARSRRSFSSRSSSKRRAFSDSSRASRSRRTRSRFLACSMSFVFSVLSTSESCRLRLIPGVLLTSLLLLLLAMRLVAVLVFLEEESGEDLGTRLVSLVFGLKIWMEHNECGL